MTTIGTFTLASDGSFTGEITTLTDPAITPEMGDDHAAYIDRWLKVLKDDTRLIFSAAAHAQRAAGFLHCQVAGNTAI